MCDRLDELQRELAEVRRNTIMQVSTGEILTNVILQDLLAHLKLEARRDSHANNDHGFNSRLLD